MPKTTKVKTEVKEKKVKKAPVKAKTEPKAKPVKSPKTVKPVLKVIKKAITPKVKVEKEVKKTAPAPKTETVKPAETPKTPKLKKVRATASVGTFNLKGKDAELLKKYQHGKNDTGSTEVQVALFTAKINLLSKHLKKHTKDSDSKRGLLIMVGKRRRLLNYLAKTDQKRYEGLIVDLGLRK